MARIRTLGLLSLAMVLLASAPAGAGSAPAVGTPAGGTDLASLQGVTVTSGGYAIPLRGARPDWYTGTLQRAVEAYGTVAAPAQAPLPSTVGIRPGAVDDRARGMHDELRVPAGRVLRHRHRGSLRGTGR